MSLRRRLVVALTGLLLVVAVAFTAVAVSQRAYLVGQLDERLAGLSARTKALVAVANRAEAGNAGAATLLTDVYVGIHRVNGTLTTILAPDDQPGLVPVLLGDERDAGPLTRATTGGSGERVRLVEAPLAQRSVVVAVSMAGVEAASRRLVWALALAWAAIAGVALLVGYWVDRLGLRPIARLTEAAAQVTASGGRAPVQVNAGHPGTEAGRLGAAFNAMVTTTAAGQEQLRRFVADASHELRTPLTTLRGYSALYAQGGLAGEAQVADAMRRINAEASRMSRIVDDLLDLAALGDGAALDRRPLDLAAVLDELASDLRVREPDREVTVAGPAQAVVPADGDRVRQALTALVANAVKYSPAGSPVGLAASRRPGAVRVEVTDRGQGVEPAELPRVFDRFYRAGHAASGARGTGLGLAIVAAIVTAHGGRYGVDSVPGRGSTFWIELPADPGRFAE